MDTDVFEHTICKMSNAGIHLKDLDIFKRELADTISNYFLYFALEDFVSKDEDFELFPFMHRHHITLESLKFLKNNCHKISYITEAMEPLRGMRDNTDEEFQLAQKLLIVLLGKDLEWKKVLKMREIFGIRRNLKKKNEAIMIHNLHQMLKDISEE